LPKSCFSAEKSQQLSFYRQADQEEGVKSRLVNYTVIFYYIATILLEEKSSNDTFLLKTKQHLRCSGDSE